MLVSLENIIGAVGVLVTAGLIFVFAYPRLSRVQTGLRTIPAFRRLRRAIGLAVEEGERLHVSIGQAEITNSNSASALVGLSTLERIAQISVVSDRPPIGTSGNGSLSILSQDTLKAAYRIGNALDQYDPDLGRLTGPTPFSYVAGAIPVIRDENIAANILIGNFGPEVAFLTDSSDRAEAFSLAASDALPAQAVMYATAEEPLIGEELFAVPAYLQAGPFHLGSLKAQDVIRWFLIAALVIGAILKIVEQFTGISIL